MHYFESVFIFFFFENIIFEERLIQKKVPKIRKKIMLRQMVQLAKGKTFFQVIAKFHVII